MSALREQMNEIMNRLEELENSPSELTKDALLAELRGFYDAVKNADTTPSSEAVTETVTEKPAAQEEAEEPEPQPAPTPVAEEVEEEPQLEPEQLAAEPVAEIEETPVHETVEEPVAEAKPAVEALSEKKPLIGKEEKADKSSDEKILAGQLSRKPLEDLRTGIPLNEKFGIIRSLFKGNASDYGDAVLKLNNAASPTEMQHYLDLLQQRFGWDLESEAYATFSVYVERKMLTLETSDANTDQ